MNHQQSLDECYRLMEINIREGRLTNVFYPARATQAVADLLFYERQMINAIIHQIQSIGFGAANPRSFPGLLIQIQNIKRQQEDRRTHMLTIQGPMTRTARAA